MKVAAFNAKKLGYKKASSCTVSRYLTRILSRYSVVVVLEVVDKTNKAKNLLLRKLNETAKHEYDMISSSDLGRSTYKEQFVCFFRTKEVTLMKHYQYEDNKSGKEDVFAREPFILRFKCHNTVVKDLALIPVHTKPEDSVKELDELYEVVMDVKKKWRRSKIMLLGDFNADGPYLPKKKKQSIRIYSKEFHWLIDDDVDTTASNSNDNTYDRIVVYGKAFKDAIVPNSAKAFNFQRAFRLTDERAHSISDHYPVEVKLKTEAGLTSNE